MVSNQKEGFKVATKNIHKVGAQKNDEFHD